MSNTNKSARLDLFPHHNPNFKHILLSLDVDAAEYHGITLIGIYWFYECKVTIKEKIKTENV